MKKKNIISLIKYYVEKNDAGFRNEAYEIAREFDASGDYQLSEYIMSLLSNVNTFVPQVSENVSSFFEKIEKKEDMLLLPEEITGDLLGVVNAIEHHTTGSIDISAIGKCVYVADKLDPLRGYNSAQQIEVCKKDIHQGFRNSLNEFYEFSIRNNRNIDECFYEIYDYFVTKGEI